MNYIHKHNLRILLNYRNHISYSGINNIRWANYDNHIYSILEYHKNNDYNQLHLFEHILIFQIRERYFSHQKNKNNDLKWIN